MLAELKQAHEDLLASIAALETMVEAPAPDNAKLASVRLKLSRASSKRRRIVEEAGARLLEGATPDIARRVNLLRENSTAMQGASSQHVGQWSIDRIAADWQGYCRASDAMRRSMRERIALERSVLYPLLERLES